MEDNKKKGLGMVLEGGGMRGLYTAGVLDELCLLYTSDAADE